MNKSKVIIKKYSGTPPYGHCFWLPGKNDQTFSCTETLLNTVTLLLRPSFFGLLVTLLTGFHCALLIEVVDVFNIIIENDRWRSLFFPQSSVLRANSKMMQIDDKRRGPRQRAKNESYMQASLILLILQSTSLHMLHICSSQRWDTDREITFLLSLFSQRMFQSEMYFEKLWYKFWSPTKLVCSNFKYRKFQKHLVVWY